MFSSYQIPRLLFIAHKVWFDLRMTSKANLEYFVQKFEEEAIIYYSEMSKLLLNDDFSISDIAHVLLCCGVHFNVHNIYSNVPGTNLKWNMLIENSLIFPYLDNCFIFPFNLVWSEVGKSPGSKEKFKDKKCEIEDYCSSKIKNLDIKVLHISYDDVCSMDLYNLGMRFESLFVASLAVKYYISSIFDSSKFLAFSELYDSDGEDISYLLDYKVNLEQGIDYPGTEKFATDSSLPFGIIHNKSFHNAHHDILIPAKTLKNNIINIAVSVKASFKRSDHGIIQRQCLSRNSQQSPPVEILIWLYLGDGTGKLNQRYGRTNVIFLNGSGCCNGLAFDQFVLLKKLKSQNNN